MMMRVWIIHPGYLSRQSLLGEHSEIHALYSVIRGKKRGFARHPETQRWTDSLNLLVLRHELISKEMELRKFQHNSPLNFIENNHEQDSMTPVSYVDLPSHQFEILRERYSEKKQTGRIPLPVRGTDFWAHHKYSVMARGYQYYHEVQKFMKSRPSLSIGQENDLITRIYTYMKMEISLRALHNVMLHCWGYFKNQASAEDQKIFFDQADTTERMNMLYALAKKYQQQYLLQSTVFADFFPPDQNSAT